MKSILVTGGFGNLGTWIVRDLLAQGHTATILAGRDRDLFTGEAMVLPADIADPNITQHVLEGREFDHVVHLASVNDNFGPGYAEKAFRVNTWGTRNLLEALNLEKLQSFIYFSTFHVYGKTTGTVTEETPLAYKHDYASTHAFAEGIVEQFHRTHGLSYTTVRLTNSYGAPVDPQTSKWYLVLNDFTRQAYLNDAISCRADKRTQRDFIWMGDVAAAVRRLVERDAGLNDTFNLSNGTSRSLEYLAQEVSKAYQDYRGGEPNVQLPFNEEQPDPEPLVVPNAKIRAALDLNFHDRFEAEAMDIFYLLERQDEPAL